MFSFDVNMQGEVACVCMYVCMYVCTYYDTYSHKRGMLPFTTTADLKE